MSGYFLFIFFTRAGAPNHGSKDHNLFPGHSFSAPRKMKFRVKSGIIIIFGMAAMPLPLLFPIMKPYRNCPKPFKYHQASTIKLLFECDR